MPRLAYDVSDQLPLHTDNRVGLKKQQQEQEQKKLKKDQGNQVIDRKKMNFAARLVLPLLSFVELNPPSRGELPEQEDTFHDMLKGDKKEVDMKVRLA